MAAEFLADLERALQIDPRAGLPRADIRLRERLGRRFDLEDAAGLAIRARTQGGHGQADAGAGDRGADRDCRGVERAGDRHVQVAALLDLGDGADGGDDPGEHQPG